MAKILVLADDRNPYSHSLVNQVSVCCQQPNTVFPSTGMTTTCGTRFGALCSPVFIPAFSAAHLCPYSLSKTRVSSNLVGRVREKYHHHHHRSVKNCDRADWKTLTSVRAGGRRGHEGPFLLPPHIPGSCLKPWPYTDGGETNPANEVA